MKAASDRTYGCDEMKVVHCDVVSSQRSKGASTRAGISAAFYAKYAASETEKAIVDELTRRGWRRSLAYDRYCVLQWAPFSKIKWKRFFEEDTIVSNYYVHSGLGRKAELFEVLSTYASSFSCSPEIRYLREAILPFHTFHTSSSKKVIDVAFSDAKSRVVWVLKRSSSNNSIGVHIVSNRRSALDIILRDQRRCVDVPIEDAKNKASNDKWLLQRHVDRPLLIRRRKFHFRANILAIGALRLYIHQDVVAHVSTKNYDASHLQDRTIHITNHCVQRHASNFDPSSNTLLERGVVDILSEDIGRERAEAMYSKIFYQMKMVSKLVFLAFEHVRDGRKLFLPMLNCFELFGLDFIVDETGQVFLLEVNTGPGLEGHCMPTLSQRIVRDTLNLLLDGSPCPSNRFEKIFDQHYRGHGEANILSDVLKSRLTSRTLPEADR